MFCCKRQQPIKKKMTAPVFEKQKGSIREDTNIIYPKNQIQFQKAQKISADQKKKLKKKLRKNRLEIVTVGSEAKIVADSNLGGQRTVLKKIQTCGYALEELDKRYKGTKDRWTDPDFDYGDLVIGNETLKWKRPEQFLKAPDLFPDEITPNDIIQGRLNDCYFLSSVAALAEKEHRILNLFTTQEYNPNGYYIVKLNFNGILQEVIIDDLFPVDSRNQLVYAQAPQRKYIWTLVLEKCWAKLLKGYKNTNYGYTSESFQTLTGAPTTNYLIKSYKTKQDPKCEFLFKKLLEAEEKQYCVMTSISSFNSPQQRYTYEKIYGLPSGHAYTLLGTYEVKLTNNSTVRLLQIRNPWGTTQSKLAWNDNDPKWKLVSETQKKRINFQINTSDNDGVFYIDWDTFIEKFEHLLSISEVDDDANYLYLEMQAQDRIPFYLQIQTNGEPEDLAIYFVQPMQLHFKQEIDYCGINVILSQQKTRRKGGEQTYKFLNNFMYYDNNLDNYLTIPKKQFKAGKYILRVYVYWPKPCNSVTPVVVGLYSSAIVGMRQRFDIDDTEFIEKNCFYTANKDGTKYQLQNDPTTWFCNQIFPASNLGYFVFHHGGKSPYNAYQISFDETNNKDLYFLLDYRGKTKFKVDSQRGYELCIVYAYNVQYTQAMNKTLYPQFQAGYRQPKPQIKPK